MIIGVYLLNFALMFPYFEMLKWTSDKEDDPSLTDLMSRNQSFYFFFIPLQFGVATYLTYFETKKMIETKDKKQLLIIVYNFMQIVIPIIDLVENAIGERLGDTIRSIWRALQFGLNANFIIMGLLVLFYKIKYLNIAQFYITRLFLVINEIYPLLFLIFVSEIAFSYAYKIIYEIDPSNNQGLGIIFKSFNFFFE
jgi:hypothetical protein